MQWQLGEPKGWKWNLGHDEELDQGTVKHREPVSLVSCAASLSVSPWFPTDETSVCCPWAWREQGCQSNQQNPSQEKGNLSGPSWVQCLPLVQSAVGREASSSPPSNRNWCEQRRTLLKGYWLDHRISRLGKLAGMGEGEQLEPQWQAHHRIGFMRIPLPVPPKAGWVVCTPLTVAMHPHTPATLPLGTGYALRHHNGSLVPASLHN